MKIKKIRFFYFIYAVFGLITFNVNAQKTQYLVPEAEGKSKMGFFTPDGNDLLMYSSGGMFFLHGNTWKNISEFVEGQLSSKHVRSISKDSKGNFWIGFGNNSIQQIRAGKLINFSPKTEVDQLLIRGSVNQIISLDTAMLLASDYGLFLMDLEMNVIRHFSFVQAFPDVVHSFNTSDLMRCIVQDKYNSNIVWVSGTMGLASINLETNIWKHHPMPVNQIKESLEPKFNTDDYNNLMVTHILQIDNQIFCATWGNGIMSYNTLTKRWQSHLFQKTTPIVPLDENIISQLCKINDSILIATTQAYKSPVLFDFKNSKFINFKNYFQINPSFDYTDGIALYGTNLWIGYYNSVERYDLTGFVNQSQEAIQSKPRISQITIDGKDHWQKTLFTNHEIKTNLTFDGSKAEITFVLPVNQSQILEYAWGDTSKINITEKAKVSLSIGVNEETLFFRVKGNKNWESVRLSRKALWFEQPLIYVIGVLLLAFSLILMISYRRKKRADEAQKKLELENRMLQLERKALQAQINPHFIFNCLVSIKSLIVNKEKKVATDFVNEFAHFIRQVLNFTNLEKVTVLEELEILRKYVNIESQRFEQELKFDIENIDNINLNEVYLPPLVLQPFIENAIWHGLIPKRTTGHICLKFTPVNKRILLEILDDGVGLYTSKTNQKAQQSLGISITRNRLNNFFRCEIDCLIEERSDMPGAVVKIWIPHLCHNA